MRHRQLKKLCKKSAELISKKTSIDGRYQPNSIAIDESDKLHLLWFPCSAETDEHDTINTWEYLMDQMILFYTEYSESGMNYIGPTVTPKSVFSWVKDRNQTIQS